MIKTAIKAFENFGVNGKGGPKDLQFTVDPKIFKCLDSRFYQMKVIGLSSETPF